MSAEIKSRLQMQVDAEMKFQADKLTEPSELAAPSGSVPVEQYRAALLLAKEMALELRMRCNEEIHHAQCAQILQLLAEIDGEIRRIYRRKPNCD